MNETTDILKIKIEEAKKQLPIDALAAINSIDWKGAIIDMRDKKGFSFEQIEDLELETELLLAGLTTPENFPKELETRMKLPSAKVDELVNEMNEVIFKKIREKLIQITTENKITRIQPVKKIEVNRPEIPKINIPINVAAKEGISTPTSPSITIAPTPKTDTQPYSSGDLKFAQSKEIEELLAKVEGPKIVDASVQAPNPLEIPADKSSVVSSKLSGSFQIPAAKTEYSLQNISKTGLPSTTSPAAMPVPTPPISKVPQVDPYREMPE